MLANGLRERKDHYLDTHALGVAQQALSPHPALPSRSHLRQHGVGQDQDRGRRDVGTGEADGPGMVNGAVTAGWR